MPEFVPVEHDPFISTPVDHDPFAEPGPQFSLQPTPPVPTQQDIERNLGQAALSSVFEPFKKTLYSASPMEAAQNTVEQVLGMIGPPGAKAAGAGVLAAAPLVAKVARAAETELPAAESALSKAIRAYHGSPHDFEKFDISKIGTGEGAQAFGHGLYFAENPSVAKEYREGLSGISTRVQQNSAGQWQGIAYDNAGQRAINVQTFDSETEAQKWADFVHSTMGKDTGKTYEVSINADPDHFLHWNKPFTQQSPKVQEAINNLWTSKGGSLEGRESPPFVASSSGDTGEAIHAAIATTYGREGNNAAAQAAATEALKAQGVPGIKYLDQGSRNVNGAVNLETKYRATNLDSSSNAAERFFASRFKENNGDLDKTVTQLQSDLARNPNDDTVRKTLDFARDTGNKFTYDPPKAQTHNYVVFDDKLIDILKKYGIAGLIAGGGAHFSTTPIDHDPFALVPVDHDLFGGL